MKQKIMKKAILGLSALLAIGCQSSIDSSRKEPVLSSIEYLAKSYATSIAMDEFDTVYVNCGPTIDSDNSPLVLFKHKNYVRTQIICGSESEINPYTFLNIILEFERGTKGWNLHDMLTSTLFFKEDNESLSTVIDQITNQTRRIMNYTSNPVKESNSFENRLARHINYYDSLILLYFNDLTNTTGNCYNVWNSDGIIYTRKDDRFRYVRKCLKYEEDKGKDVLYLGEGREVNGKLLTTDINLVWLDQQSHLKSKAKNIIEYANEHSKIVVNFLDFKKSSKRTYRGKR